MAGELKDNGAASKALVSYALKQFTQFRNQLRRIVSTTVLVYRFEVIFCDAKTSSHRFRKVLLSSSSVDKNFNLGDNL